MGLGTEWLGTQGRSWSPTARTLKGGEEQQVGHRGVSRQQTCRVAAEGPLPFVVADAVERFEKSDQRIGLNDSVSIILRF